jgi:hypothetical protein
MTRLDRFGEFASVELAEAVHCYKTQRSGLGSDLLDAVEGSGPCFFGAFWPSASQEVVERP